MKNGNTIGLAAEYRVCAKFLDRGLFCSGPLGYNCPGIDILVAKKANSTPKQIEVKTTNSSTCTIGKIHLGKKGYYVIERRSQKGLQYYTLTPDELRDIAEDRIGIGQKIGVKVSKLKKYRDDNLMRVFSAPKKRTPYWKAWYEIRPEIDRKARKKRCGNYKSGWNIGKVNKLAHKETKKRMK